MKILVINAGSSSLKFQLFQSDKNFLYLYKGIVDRIGQKNSPNHTEAVKLALKTLLQKKVIRNLNEIQAIGHRVVHGGEKYQNATKLTAKVIAEIKKLCSLAPLHNPPNLAAIIACSKAVKNVPQVAVFDTAFHQTLPEKAYLYAIPLQFYKKYGIRRYGFHGTSHQYVSRETIKLLGKKNAKIVTCHLGNGASVCAVVNGKSIDTSMGFTPLEGLPMGTRCGDLDPAIVYKLQEILKLSTKEIDELLNKKSGLKGLSGLSSDIRDLWKNYKKNRMARLALSILAYRTAKYIGAYSTAMKGLDAITFTAGIGENAYYVRKEILSYLPHLGVKIDGGENRKNSVQIQAKNSRVKVFVIPTNEEKEIAMETAAVLKNK